MVLFFAHKSAGLLKTKLMKLLNYSDMIFYKENGLSISGLKYAHLPYGPVPDKWEIEHIFPQKWQTNYFPDVPDDVVKEKIEHLGNKLPFEKKLNIVAGNGYFKKKQKEYADSKVTITNAMSSPDIMNWNMDSIIERDIRTSDEILKILHTWDDAYNNITTGQAESDNVPSAEQQAMIEEFRKKGWV